MSSEEVAELAQAIHNHADALYESWTKGQEAMNMKRMEDTLELLADPGLTPKLEHLVSSFVRRDKAKRQFHNQPTPQQRSQKSPPKNSLDPQDISQEQNDREPSPGSMGRKALPKSILAVVQRFEQPPSQDITRERSPSSIFVPSNSTINTIPIVVENNNGTVDGGGVGGGLIAGVGPVTRNVIWETSSSKQHISERKVGRMSSPVLSISPVNSAVSKVQNGIGGGGNSNKVYNSVQRSSPTPVDSVVVLGKERHIPIERYDEPSANNVPSNTNAPVVVKANGYSSLKPKNASNTPVVNTLPTTPPFKNEMRELEREEERLFHALRTGQVVQGTFSSHHSPTQNVPPDSGTPTRGNSSNEAAQLSPTGSSNSGGSGSNSPTTNGYSRVAFAKERIRQSQQHPLTQQRLEMQKRLPSPSGSLAAAIAVQQGKLKFQPPSPTVPLTSHPLFNPVEDEPNIAKENQYTGGYHSRFNGFRFGPGSSVADRVQMFEKYPTTSILNQATTNGASPPQSSPSSPRLLTCSSQGPLDATNSISSSIVAARKQQLQQPSSILTSTTTAPWRTSPGRENGIPSNVIAIANVNSLAPSSNGTHHHHHQQPSYHHHHLHTQSHQHPQLFQIHIDTSASGIPKGQSSSPKTPVDSPRGVLSKRSGKDVPRFYFPEGKPVSPNIIEETLAKAEEEMKSQNGVMNYSDFADILSTLGIPIFWKKPFWTAMGLSVDESCSAFTFIPFLRNLLTDCPDDASRFVRILNAASIYTKNLASQNNNNNNNNNNSPMKSKYGGQSEVFKEDVRTLEIGMSDMVPMIQDIIDTHKGLGFLRDAPEFHSRYITTVVSRIFYKVNRSWSGRISLSELRRSNLLRIIKRLEEETDINNVTEYFSYEHFYVIYCKFWELDKDHDLLIDKTDLRGHADHALSGRIIERIFSGTVLRGWDMTSTVRAPSDKMTYSDFVWFLLSEEDKKTPTAIEYWFRCLDLDGDGVLSPFELQYFYAEQETRIEALGIEPLDFGNVYCQVVDMLQCSSTGIRLKDFKRNPQLAANVFNTLFNLDKYLEHEQRDPFAAAASGASNPDGFETESDWDKYAAAEYELLIAEETPSDHMHNSDLEEATSPT